MRLSTIKNNGRTLPITFLNSSTHPTPYGHHEITFLNSSTCPTLHDHHEITQSLVFLIEKEMYARKWEINDFIDLHIELRKASQSRKGKKKKKKRDRIGETFIYNYARNCH